MTFHIEESCLIPLRSGQAVTRGWPAAIGRMPLGVTWHWTVTRDLALCRRVLGGANAERRGAASAHYGVGRSFAEGVDRYVSLENRSWHAGINQLYRWDGRPLEDPSYKGSRSTIGVETVHMGHSTPGMPAAHGWIDAASPLGRKMRIQPWTEEQVAMMIAIGKEIIDRWPNIGPRDHHGHHDLCPTYKVDVPEKVEIDVGTTDDSTSARTYLVIGLSTAAVIGLLLLVVLLARANGGGREVHHHH